MELNFFDTNPAAFILCLSLGNVRKQLPIWDWNLQESMRIEVRLHSQDWAETIVVVRVTVVTIGIEYSGIRAIPPITTAFQERLSATV